MAKKKLELTARTLELIAKGIPDPAVGPTDNRFVALLKDLLLQVNELNGYTTTTATPVTTGTTTTTAPTTTVP